MGYVKIQHRCPLPTILGHRNLWRCDECGRLWRSYAPGNPEYNSWRRVWWTPSWLAHRDPERARTGGYPAGDKTAAEMQPPPANICRPRQKG